MKTKIEKKEKEKQGKTHMELSWACRCVFFLLSEVQFANLTQTIYKYNCN